MERKKAGDYIRWGHTIWVYRERVKQGKGAERTYRFVEITLHEAQRECTLANTTGAEDHRAELANMLMVMMMIMCAHHGWSNQQQRQGQEQEQEQRVRFEIIGN